MCDSNAGVRPLLNLIVVIAAAVSKPDIILIPSHPPTETHEESKDDMTLTSAPDSSSSFLSTGSTLICAVPKDTYLVYMACWCVWHCTYSKGLQARKVLCEVCTVPGFSTKANDTIHNWMYAC